MLQAFRKLIPAHNPMDRVHGATIGSTAYIGVDFANSPIGFVLDSSRRGHWWDTCIPVGLCLSPPCGHPFELNFAQTVEIQANQHGPVVIERTLVYDAAGDYKPIKIKYIHAVDTPRVVRTPDYLQRTIPAGLRTTTITNLPMTMGVHRTVENTGIAQVIDPRTQLLSLALEAAHNQTSWAVGYHDRLYEAVSLLDQKYKPFRHYTKHSFGRRVPQEDLSSLIWDLYGFNEAFRINGRDRRKSDDRRSVESLLRERILPIMPAVDPEALRDPHKEQTKRQIIQRIERPILHPDVAQFAPVDQLIDQIGITDYQFRPEMMDAIQMIDEIPMSDWDARYISLDGYSVRSAHFSGCRYYGGLFKTDIRVDEPPEELDRAVQEFLAQTVALFQKEQNEEVLRLLKEPVSIRVYRRNTEDVLVCLHQGHEPAPDDSRPIYSAYYFLPLLSLVNMGIAYKEDYTLRRT